MGIDLNCAQLLIRAKANGLSFGRMGMLGRQGLHANRPALVSILRAHGYDLSPELQRTLLDPATVYAEEFFRLLGAKEIIAIDRDGYEGAEVLHNMNEPIPNSLESSFDLLLDGGTLEHVFNFPVGARNCLRMVRPGGRLIHVTIANNFCGHGFYQFSPELFYRLLSTENGYELECCIEWEEVNGSRFYQVPDPASFSSRIELTSRAGTYLVVQAKRIGEPPQVLSLSQSDYVRHWTAASNAPENGAVRAGGGIRSLLKKNTLLRSGVIEARKIARERIFRKQRVNAEYRRRLLHKNSSGYLKPLEGIRVWL